MSFPPSAAKKKSVLWPQGKYPVTLKHGSKRKIDFPKPPSHVQCEVARYDWELSAFGRLCMYSAACRSGSCSPTLSRVSAALTLEMADGRLFLSSPSGLPLGPVKRCNSASGVGKKSVTWCVFALFARVSTPPFCGSLQFSALSCGEPCVPPPISQGAANLLQLSEYRTSQGAGCSTSILCVKQGRQICDIRVFAQYMLSVSDVPCLLTLRCIKDGCSHRRLRKVSAVAACDLARTCFPG